MRAHVLQQDGAGTVRKAVQSLPKVILVLLRTAGAVQQFVPAAGPGQQGQPHNGPGFWRWNSSAQQCSSHSTWHGLYSWRAAQQQVWECAERESL